MRAEAFLPDAIRRSTKLSPRRSRFPSPREAAGPSVRWRKIGFQGDRTIDGPMDPHVVFFEVECRAQSPSAARAIGQQPREVVSPHLTHLLARYDHQDDRSL